MKGIYLVEVKDGQDKIEAGEWKSQAEDDGLSKAPAKEIQLFTCPPTSQDTHLPAPHVIPAPSGPGILKMKMDSTPYSSWIYNSQRLKEPSA